MPCELNCGFRTWVLDFKEETVNYRAKSQILAKEQVGGDKVKTGIFFPKKLLKNIAGA